MTRHLSQVVLSLPSEVDDSPLEKIRELQMHSGQKVVVLDDDPTGTQTVHDVAVLTDWSIDSLSGEFSKDGNLFFILTNSRALTDEKARTLTHEIAKNLRQAADATGCDLAIISRSDSTLRGHYPTEVDALRDSLGQTDAIEVLVPFFAAGGRLTFDDVHYVANGDELVPVSDTPFAKDATFGFKNSNLKDWVIEKRGSNTNQEQIHSVSIKQLRTESAESIAEFLQAIPPGEIVIVNALTDRDVEVFALAARVAESTGMKMIFRTAAGFVRAYAGQKSKPELSSDQLIDSTASNGLIVVGSYVPKTTRQLDCLLSHTDQLRIVELNVERTVDSAITEVQSAIQRCNEFLDQGCDVLLQTSRTLVTGKSAESSLKIVNQVSKAVVEVVENIQSPLRFLVAKGGITSSDIATKALKVRRAIVMGQILPGVPVWRLQSESTRPGLPYVVFPGNVGDDQALFDAYKKLHHPNERNE